MFKSKFKEVMKRSEGFEVIKDASAVSVQGGGDCSMLVNCGTFSGDCDNLSSCTSYDTCSSIF